MDKLQIILRQGIVTKVSNDTKFFPGTQVKSFDSVDDYVMALPYGLSSSPPVGTPGIILQIGTSKKEIFIPLSNETRTKGIKSGEVIIENPATNSRVHFKENGDIDITSNGNLKATVTGDTVIDSGGNVDINAGGDASITAGGNVTIDASETTINSDTTINGNLIVTGTITGAGITSTTTVTATTSIAAATISLGGTALTATHKHTETGVITTGPIIGT